VDVCHLPPQMVEGLPHWPQVVGSDAAAHVEDLVPVSARGAYSWLILSRLSVLSAASHSYDKPARRADRECWLLGLIS
jgi:hypothetical protein